MVVVSGRATYPLEYITLLGGQSITVVHACDILNFRHHGYEIDLNGNICLIL
jgi:hypothetical protein